MYESHFGFSGPPFQLNPDPAFYFNSRGHGHALAYLRYGVAQGEGFIVVTGEIGAGKTTLLRALLDELDRAHVVAAQIVSTQLESGDLLQAIITAFGIPTQGAGKASLIATLEAFLMTLATQGRRALLVIDEAQNLEIRAIEELRMLSNFQLGTQSLLQSFLVGQPELRKKLESQEMEQLRQRVTASCHLGPLSLEETRGYVEHRLRRVGWTNRPAFDDGAFDQIYRWSGGVPRRINRLCNRLLLAAFLEGREGIVGEMVETTAAELRQEIGEAAFEPLTLPPRSVVQTTVPPPDAAAVQATVAPTEAAVVPTVPAPASVDSAEADLPVVHEAGGPKAVPVPRAVAEPELPLAGETPASVPETLVPLAAADLVAVVPPGFSESVAAGVAVSAQGGDVVGPTQATARQAVVRVEAVVLKPRVGVLLCLADTMTSALKLAAIAKALNCLPDAPRLVLVNPGVQADAWPWEEMESLLPTPDIALHLGVPMGSVEVCGPEIFARLGAVLDEFMPLGVVSLGCSDALLAASLMAHKRGLPVLRLEAGDRSRVGGGEAINAALIEQFADALLAPATPAAHQQLYRSGIEFDKVFGVSGGLAQDVVNAVLPSMTTPYGAFLRHRLPIFLGPQWSSEVDGTAYAVVTLQLDAAFSRGVAGLLDVLVDLHAVPKLLWLADDTTRDAIRQWQRATPGRAEDIFIIEDTLPRAALDRRNSARVLCSDIRSLADQLSILRGAVAVLTEPGHVLAEAAPLLDIAAITLEAGRLSLQLGAAEPVVNRPWGAVSLNEFLSQCVARGEPPAPTESLPGQPQAAAVIASRLRAWAVRRLEWLRSPAKAVVNFKRNSTRNADASDRESLAA